MSAVDCIRIEALHYHYTPRFPALNGIDLAIPDNAFLAIVGQNGAGKTTLIRHLNGLLKPTSGNVWVFGQNTRTLSVGALARTVGLVFQNPDHQIFCSTTREELAFGPKNLGLAPAEVEERVADALQVFDLHPFAETPPAVLGFGLRRKVAIASVYAMRPRVFVLDEPTAGLDARSAGELLRLMAILHGRGHTIIWVSHDMRLVAEHALEVLVLQDGRALAFGPTREVLARTEMLKDAGITPPPVTELGQRLGDIGLPDDLLTVDEFVRAVQRLHGGQGEPQL